jgi:hypothetical protein
MEYKASLDITSKIITGVITVLFLCILSFSSWMIFSAPAWGTDSWVHLGSGCLILGIYVFTYAYRPAGYVVEKNQLTVQRPYSDYHLPMQEIKNISLVNKEVMKWTIRTFGVGGLFGYFGKFANRELGSMTWYATQLKNYVLIETTDNKKIIVTPDDTGMVMEIEKLLNR